MIARYLKNGLTVNDLHKACRILEGLKGEGT